jgi:hypothetical protein
LTSITVPNSVTSIGDRVFDECSSLVSITIPEYVTIIEESTGCSNTISVISLNPTPPSIKCDDYSWVKKFEDTTLYVPSESIELYKSAEGWKDFGTITAYVPANEA